MFKLTPSSTRFYDFFDALSDVLVQTSEHFRDGLAEYGSPQKLAAAIKDLEHKGDELTHETTALLHKSFITPLERSDIRALVVSLDDVLDAVDDAASRIALYEIREILPGVRELSGVLVEGTKLVQKAVHEVRNLKRKNTILELCIRIHQVEDEGDRVFDRVLSGLFKSGLDALSVIQWKDIIEDLEIAIDCCQDVSEVLEGIVLENS